MTGLYFLLPTLLAIFISFLVVRAAAIALMMTGLDKKRAVFQALSAFTGTGFTTREAERVVGHPKRRLIITWLMILGNAGIVTVIVATTASMVRSGGSKLPLNVLLLAIGILIIYRVATSKGFVKSWEDYIEEKLIKHRVFEEAPVEDLLHILEGYGLVRAVVAEDSSLAGKALSEIRSGEKHIIFLGIERGHDWMPVPKATEKILPGDKVVAYGHVDTLKEHFKGEE
jgi:hypothetical protein